MNHIERHVIEQHVHAWSDGKFQYRKDFSGLLSANASCYDSYLENRLNNLDVLEKKKNVNLNKYICDRL